VIVFLCDSSINSQKWTHVMSDATLHVNMTLLKVEDQLQVKTSQTGKGWIIEK